MERDRVIGTLAANRQVLQAFGVKSLRVFGSVARGDAQAGSDVDLLVEFDPAARIGLFEFSRLRQKLSDLLGCDVDLATPEALHRDLKDAILREAIRAC